MDLILLVLGIAVAGFLVWLITTYIKMDPIFKLVIYAVVAVAMILWLLDRFGHSIPNVLHK
jgi:cation transporter-like permease